MNVFSPDTSLRSTVAQALVPAASPLMGTHFWEVSHPLHHDAVAA
jgi:hypothetical protein